MVQGWCKQHWAEIGYLVLALTLTWFVILGTGLDFLLYLQSVVQTPSTLNSPVLLIWYKCFHSQSSLLWDQEITTVNFWTSYAIDCQIKMTLSEDLPLFLLQIRMRKHRLPVTLAVLQNKPVPPTRYRISHFQDILTPLQNITFLHMPLNTLGPPRVGEDTMSLVLNIYVSMKWNEKLICT